MSSAAKKEEVSPAQRTAQAAANAYLARQTTPVTKDVITKVVKDTVTQFQTVVSETVPSPTVDTKPPTAQEPEWSDGDHKKLTEGGVGALSDFVNNPSAGYRLTFASVPSSVAEIADKELVGLSDDMLEPNSAAYRFHKPTSTALRQAFTTADAAGRVCVTIFDGLSSTADDYTDTNKTDDNNTATSSTEEPEGDLFCSGALFPNSLFFKGVEEYVKRNTTVGTFEIALHVVEGHSFLSYQKAQYDHPKLMKQSIRARTTTQIDTPVPTADGLGMPYFSSLLLFCARLSFF
jgi:hypothetical protein